MAQPLLDELLERLDWSNPQADIVDWDEASQWGPEALSLLLESSVIVPVEPAQSVVCDACYDAHVEEVRFLPSPDDGQFRAFISCPQCGPVAVEPQRLQRWQIRLEGFINLCSLVANDSVPPRVILPGRLIDLGAVKLDDMRVRTLIGRGLAWRDRNALLDRVRGSVGDSEAILLVPSEAPTVFTDNIRVVPMLGNLVAGDNGVRVRLPSLRPSNVPIAGASNSLQKLGAGWRVTFRGETRIVKNTLGMRYLAHLLAKPHAYFRATVLVALVRGSAPTVQIGTEFEIQALRVDEGGDAGEVIDADARDAYRQEYKRLTSELQEARESSDAERVDELLLKVKWMAQQLSGGTRLDGKPRMAKSTTDRARIGVTKAINTAVANVTTQLPSLGEHLAATIHTGASCSYRPEDTINWEC